jgi:ABC-type transport system involved in multi-copper enzyme maturation permease subunit
VLVPITVLQTTLLVLVAMATQNLPPRDPTGAVKVSGVGSALDSQLVELAAGVALAGVAAMALGLLISCLVRSSDRALVLLPLVLITQVVLSVPFFEADSPVLDRAGLVSSAQWGMSAAGSTLSLNDLRSVQIASNDVGRQSLFARTPPTVNARKAIATARDSGKSRWRHEAGVWLTSAGALALMTAVCLAASLLILRRPDAGAPGREQV